MQSSKKYSKPQNSWVTVSERFYYEKQVDSNYIMLFCPSKGFPVTHLCYTAVPRKLWNNNNKMSEDTFLDKLLAHYACGHSETLKVKGLVALRHSFCIFLFLFTIHTFIQSVITFPDAHLLIFSAAGSVGGTSMWCRAEIRIWNCLTANQRTTTSLHTDELRCTLVSNAAPYCIQKHCKNLHSMVLLGFSNEKVSFVNESTYIEHKRWYLFLMCCNNCS